MRRSQPLDESNEKLMKWLGVKEETEEEKAAGKQVVKVETVDSMFDISEFKPTLWNKAASPFYRFKRHLSLFNRGVKNVWKWRKLFTEYYEWDIRAFLPLFVKHLELYIDGEKKYGIATPECKEYKISTAQEAVDILKRLVADEYETSYFAAVEEKWGKFPYEKTTHANGSTGYLHLTPDGYDVDRHAAYEKAMADEQNDLKRLGELVEKNMLDWWD